MNYENFYEDAQLLEKGIKEKLTNAQKAFKNISKSSENGDLKALGKELSQMQSLLSDVQSLTDEMQGLTEGFDAKQYMDSGDFAKQMIEYCHQYSVDVQGEFPIYEIFPYKVKIDAENQDLYVNRKKLQCVRPLSFVKNIKISREKYIKAAFNANVFINELAAAYDIASTVKNSKNKTSQTEYDLLLRDLYDYMVPTQRARKEYDLQNYASDLARLYGSETDSTKDGRKIDFGTSRVTNKLIRILDQDGKEQHLGTVRFYKLES